ncbi:hypothetical protein [uncultured Desulfobacter sp.]|uniref:hypothetical protein n=1 Tax=uncultured Desulfobacter sp. TaxID=240139 RepID=UPI002AAA97A1|nr:hypothetical protein [uncultured Desulfobacter sp.]
MGALTRKRPMDDIVDELNPNERIAVISCNNCVKISGAGGEGVWEGFCDDLEQRGFRIEDRVLITNPCSRGYLENLTLSPVVKTVVLLACEGAQNGFKTIFPDIRLVAANDTLGLFVASKADGVVKLAMTFPGYEALQDKEFKLKDTQVMLDGEKIHLAD